MAGVKMSQELLNLRKAVTSFGYVVRIRNNKIFFVNPNEDEVYVATKRPRIGFYGLNRVDREMWEAMGAEGVVVFQNIITQELIKWLYDRILESKRKGLSEFKKRSERPAVTLSRRIGRDHKKEYEQKVAREREREKSKAKRKAHRE